MEPPPKNGSHGSHEKTTPDYLGSFYYASPEKGSDSSPGSGFRGTWGSSENYSPSTVTGFFVALKTEIESNFQVVSKDLSQKDWYGRSISVFGENLTLTQTVERTIKLATEQRKYFDQDFQDNAKNALVALSELCERTRKLFKKPGEEIGSPGQSKYVDEKEEPESPKKVKLTKYRQMTELIDKLKAAQKEMEIAQKQMQDLPKSASNPNLHELQKKLTTVFGI